MIYTVFVTPYRVAFVDEDTLGWYVVDLTVDSLFMCDVLVNCFAAYYTPDDQLVTSHTRIFTQYLKFWLGFDLVACLPFQLIFGEGTQWGALIRLGRLPRLYRVIKFAKLFRMLKVYKNRSKVLSCLECFSHLSAGMEQLLYFLCSFLCISHLIACILYFATRFTDKGAMSWVVLYQMQDESPLTVYVSSFYWTITTITTIGYGDIIPDNSLERAICILIMITGIFFYSYTIGTITSLLARTNQKQTRLQRKLTVLQRIAKQFKFSKRFFGRLREALEYTQADQRKERNEVLQCLPKKLSTRLYLTINQPLIESNRYFSSRPIEFIAMVVKYVKPLKVAPREYLYRKGEFSDELYFLVTGEVGLYEICEDEEVLYTVVGPGEYFGDVELFLTETRQTASRAKSFTELLSLSKEDLFARVLKHFSELKVQMIIEAHKNNLLHNEKKYNLLEARDSVPIRTLRAQSLLMRKQTTKLLDRAKTKSYYYLRNTLAPSTRAKLDDVSRRYQYDELRKDLQDIRQCIKRMLTSIENKRVSTNLLI